MINFKINLRPVFLGLSSEVHTYYMFLASVQWKQSFKILKLRSIFLLFSHLKQTFSIFQLLKTVHSAFFFFNKHLDLRKQTFTIGPSSVVVKLTYAKPLFEQNLAKSSYKLPLWTKVISIELYSKKERTLFIMTKL